MPTVSTIPAMPGSEKVKPNIAMKPKSSTPQTVSETAATMPEKR